MISMTVPSAAATMIDLPERRDLDPEKCERAKISSKKAMITKPLPMNQRSRAHENTKSTVLQGV
jgi:hypothetical protein